MASSHPGHPASRSEQLAKPRIAGHAKIDEVIKVLSDLDSITFGEHKRVVSIAAKPRDHWTLDDVEYLVNMANRHLVVPTRRGQ